jgi:hypothetical protein
MNEHKRQFREAAASQARYEHQMWLAAKAKLLAEQNEARRVRRNLDERPTC